VNNPIKFSVGVALQVAGVAGALLLLVLIIYGYVTGQRWVGVADKSLWDWLKLLIVPIALSVAGFVLSDAAQRERDRQQSDSQAAAELDQRVREERSVSYRAQSEALASYLDQMSDLVINMHMRSQPKESDVARLAQARTFAILASLDRDRKRDPLKLIYELSLIDKNEPYLYLRDADFAAADLSDITLHYAFLRGANLRRADLKGADLKGADLSDADLRGADLSDADLSEVNLAGANLLPYDTEHPARLNNSHLANGADLTAIDLRDARLTPTKLSGINLIGADVSHAYLAGVVGITNQGLEQQTEHLEGATMPNGQKYEDWLKSKGSGKD
jgi:uncharacterized protein YjbI with pentapeptide repeats